MLISKNIKHNWLLSRTLFRNHYDTMGVHRRSTKQQIKERYLQLAKLHHPDVAGQNKSPKSFSQINIAYEILKDEDKRRQYDRTLEKEQAEETIWRYEEAKAYGSRYQQPSRERSAGNALSRAFSFLVLFVSIPLTIYYLIIVRPKPTEHEIRRQNLIMSRQNIESSPSARKKRAQMYQKQRIQKQFRIVHVQKKMNRHKNAFLSEQQMKDPQKRGKTMSGTPPPNYNILETIEGVSKMKKKVRVQQQREEYM